MQETTIAQPRRLRRIGVSLAAAALLAAALLTLLAACSSPAAPAPADGEAVATDTPAAETPETEAITETAAQAGTVPQAQAAPEETAAPEEASYLVVQFDEARAAVRPLSLTAPVSGLAALQQSGLEVVTAEFSWGTSVCSIEGVGCPAEDCFCGGDLFWNYSFWDGEAWQGYETGPAVSVISATGSVEGWRWGEFEGQAIPAPQVIAAQSALDWLHAAQVEAGGYGGTGIDVEALMAVAANGLDADTWRASPESPSLLDAVLAGGADYSQLGVAEAGKLGVALAAAEACWPADALRPQDYYSETVGAFSTDAGFLAWGILGTLALGEETPADSVDYLAGLALPEGGWEWSPGWGRDTNTTALAIQTLIAAGTPVSATEIVSGLAYLKEAQDETGGLRYDAGEGWQGAADANSTAYGLMALSASGQNPHDPVWQTGAVGPVDFLISLQQPGGGLAWQVGQEVNLGATVQAVPALLGQTFPLRRAPLEACPAEAQ